MPRCAWFSYRRSQINIPDFRLCYPCKCLARYARSPNIYIYRELIRESVPLASLASLNKLGTFNGFSKRNILYFATCFCLVLALLLLALSFSFLISLLANFSSGVSNALKALDRTFLTFCPYWASLLRTAGKQNKMLLRRLPGPRKRVGERERFVYWALLLRTAGKQNKMLLRRLPGNITSLSGCIGTSAAGTSANTPIRRVIFRVFKYNIFIMYACANLLLATTIFLELNQ